MLVVAEADDEMLAGSLVLFDADHLVDALDELDRRYREADGSSPPLVEDRVLAAFAAFNHRKWERLESVTASDVVIVDHRRLGYPEGRGASGLAGAPKALVAQVPDVVVVVERLDSSPHAALGWIQQFGTSAHGVGAEWAWISVLALDADGLVADVDWFDAEDEPQARARFAELSRT